LSVKVGDLVILAARETRKGFALDFKPGIVLEFDMNEFDGHIFAVVSVDGSLTKINVDKLAVVTEPGSR
jgi:hypothetical protein